MQGLYPKGFPSPAAPAAGDYDHHWFAVAGELGGKPAWVSCWRIESGESLFWDVTIARSDTSGYTSVESFTEQSAVVEPLTIRPVILQKLPAEAGPAFQEWRAGRQWHVSAGAGAPSDLLRLEIAVPAGQFAKSARFGAAEGLPWMEEALGSTTVTGTVRGQQLTNVRLIVAEATAEYREGFVPLVKS
jgi:hypothetical protein